MFRRYRRLASSPRRWLNSVESRISPYASFRRQLKSVRRFLYPLPLKVLPKWAQNLSDPERERWASRLGIWAYRSLSAARQRAYSHLHIAYGQTLSPEQFKQIALGSFQNLAFNVLEGALFSQTRIQTLLQSIDTFGWEHVENAYRAGHGAIFVTGHLGNWELAGAYLAQSGYPVNVVARRIYLDPLNLRLVEMRESMGVKTLYREGSMRPMIRSLRNNQFLAVVVDQDVRKVGGIFVEFFGRLAYTPVGPALLALATGAPILVGRDIRDGCRHLITVDPPIYANRDAPHPEEIRRLVTWYTKRLEEFIREHPTQWVWTHRRWRTRPPPSHSPLSIDDT
jgi:KDO2-lipid IV(A) lauroyltransferase